MAKSLAEEAAQHPCFSVLQGYDSVTYEFRPDQGYWSEKTRY